MIHVGSCSALGATNIYSLVLLKLAATTKGVVEHLYDSEGRLQPPDEEGSLDGEVLKTRVDILVGSLSGLGTVGLKQDDLEEAGAAGSESFAFLGDPIEVHWGLIPAGYSEGDVRASNDFVLKVHDIVFFFLFNARVN